MANNQQGLRKGLLHKTKCQPWNLGNAYQRSFQAPIAGTSAGCLKEFSFLISVGKPKVNQFNSFIKVNKEVLRLQITMDYSQRANILDPRDDLLKKSARLRFLYSLILYDIVEKFTARSKLHYQVELFRSFNNLI